MRTSVIVESFRRLQRDTPGRRLIYLPATESTVNAEQLALLASEIVKGFEKMRLPPGSVVGAALGNRPSAIAAFLACAERGHPLLPIDGSTAAAEVAAIGARLQAAVILVPTATQYLGYGLSRTLSPEVTAAIADQPPQTTFDACVMKLTSGSTGLPRATLTSEEALVTDSRTLIDAMGIGADTVQVAAIPLSHAYGFGNLLVPMLLQGTPVVMREAFVPQRLPEDARQVNARIFPGVPFMFEHFNVNPPDGGWPHTLEQLISAGARLERRVVDRFRTAFGRKIRSFYGTSETGGICFDQSDAVVEEGTVGPALRGMTLTLRPHEGAPGGGGRVHVRGRAVISGYAEAPDAETFADGGFLTGDLGAFDDAGRLVLAGRVSPFINIAGRKVQPSEVERALRLRQGIADVRVVGVADDRRGEQLVALLVSDEPRPSVLSLRQHCAVHLAAYKIPRTFVFLDQLPLTPRGKIDHQALADAARESVGRAD